MTCAPQCQRSVGHPKRSAPLPTGGLVAAVVGDRLTTFDPIELFEPDLRRRASLGRPQVEVAAALGHSETLAVTADVEESLTGAG